MLRESHRRLKESKQDYKMLEKNNVILRDSWFFLEISPLALHTIIQNRQKKQGMPKENWKSENMLKLQKVESQKKSKKNWKKLNKNRTICKRLEHVNMFV